MLENTVPADASQTSSDPFVDVAEESGLDFVHCNGMTGERYFSEPVGAGAALFDVDGDGDLDIYLAQGRILSPAADAEERAACPGGGRLYRNDLEVDAKGHPRLRFTDVTEESGLVATEYGMGVAAGDVDNDGRIDLYLTCFGPNQLWRNVGTEGAIRFIDVTTDAGSGLDDARWSTGATFFDADGDGWLDLFFTNYVDYAIATHRPCLTAGGREDYCGPNAFDGVADRFLRNRGDGTFEDLTDASGILAEPSSGLGVVAADLDLDGLLDLYVTNDLRRNVQWRNLGVIDGVPRFENVALESGSAVSMLGRAQASMGVVAGDVDEDGDDDLFMTHLRSDTNTLYVNNGHGQFDDRSAASGLAAPSLASTGFGTALIDMDNDGWLDLVSANGAVKVIEAQALAGDPYPLKQPNQLFRNLGKGRFEEVLVGTDLGRMEVSRGIAVGDVDNDGRSDLLLANNRGPARLLMNRSTDRNAWIGLRVIGRQGRDALGARVAVVRADGHTSWRRVATDGSYLSASDPRVLVGLGSSEPVELRVHWLGGAVERWDGLATGAYHTLVAGQGDLVLSDGLPGGT